MKALIKEDYRWGGDFEGEVWESLEFLGYPNYEVSNYGRILSLNHGLMYPKKTKSGYLHVRLSMNGNRKEFAIHRLVAMCFVENSNKRTYNVVNHRDENKINNYHKNLEWCDTAYNVTYGTAIERSTKTNEEAGNFEMLKKINRKPVYKYSFDGRLVKMFEGVSVCYMSDNVSSYILNSEIPVKNEHIYSYLELDKNEIAIIHNKYLDYLKFKQEERLKPIFQYSLQGELICETTISEIDNLDNKQRILDCCNGYSRTHNGYIWSYNQMTSDECYKVLKKLKKYKEIYRYDPRDYTCVVYKNKDEIEDEFGIAGIYSSISESRTYKGYVWDYKRLSKEQINKRSEIIDKRVKVYQYNFLGELVKVWDSIKDCIDSGYIKSNLHSCFRGDSVAHNGYIWSKSEYGESELEAAIDNVIKYSKIKPLYQYDKELNLIKAWETTTIASKNGYPISPVSEVCRGKRKAYKGYIWSYVKLDNNN